MATLSYRSSEIAKEKAADNNSGVHQICEKLTSPESLEHALNTYTVVEQNKREGSMSDRVHTVYGDDRDEHKLSTGVTFMEVRKSGEGYKKGGAQPLASDIKDCVEHSGDCNVGSTGGLTERKEGSADVFPCPEERAQREVADNAADSVKDSCKSVPEDNGSRRRFNEWGKWEGGGLGILAGESGKVVVGEADSESEERMSQRSRFDSLREQLSQLEEVAALQNVKEVGAQAEIIRLQETNGRLVAQMAVMRESVSRLESEKRAVSIRLGAMKNAMQQLEREALIRSGVQFEMVAATNPQPSQGWLTWGTKDKMAEASSIAEEARVQNAAATVLVEKLLHENAELADQLNDQSALLERLARTYGNLANLPLWDGRQIHTSPTHPETSTNDSSTSVTGITTAGQQEGSEPIYTTVPPLLSPLRDENRQTTGAESEEDEGMVTSASGGALRDHHSMSMPSHLTSDVISTRHDNFSASPQPLNQASPVRGLPYSPRSGPEGLRIGVVTSPRNANRGRSAWVDNHLAESKRLQYVQSGQSSYGSVASWNTEAFPSSPRLDKSLGVAPVFAVPFRLVQLFARYVSGADLVEKRINLSTVT